MKKKRKTLKVIGVILGVFVLVLAGFYAYLLIGMDEVAHLTIENIDIKTIPDGTYEGAFEGYRWSNSVKITVKDKRITDIEVIKSQTFADKAKIVTLIDRIKNAQSLQVDVLSGATVSSKAFLKAVENALMKGEKG